MENLTEGFQRQKISEVDKISNSVDILDELFFVPEHKIDQLLTDIPLIVSYIDLTSIPEYDKEEESPYWYHQSRTLRRHIDNKSDQSNERFAVELTKPITKLYWIAGDPAKHIVMTTIREICYKAQLGLVANEIAGALIDEMEDIAPLLKEVKLGAEPQTQELRSCLLTDDVKAFEFLNFAGNITKKSDSGNFTSTHAGYLELVRIADRQSGEELFEKLSDNLADGKYDRLFFESIYPYLINTDLKYLSNFAQTIKFTAKFCGLDEKDSAFIDRFIDSRENWPARIEVDFQQLRNMWASRINNGLQIVHNNTSIFGSKNIEKNELQLIEEIKSALVNFLGRTLELGGRVQPPALTAMVTEERKRKRRTEFDKDVNGTATAAESIEKIKEDKEFFVLKRSSADYTINPDTTVDELMAKFAAQYPGTPLYEDLRNIKDWLNNLDLSEGIVRGVKQYGTRIRVDGVEVPLFAMKPKDVPGLSTRSKRADYTRILFSLPDSNKCLVLAILNRDEVSKFEKANGFGSSASK